MSSPPNTVPATARPVVRGRGALLVSLVWTLVGVVYLVMAIQFPLGTVIAPGPGGYSILVGVLLTAAAMGCAVQVLWGTRRHRLAVAAGGEGAEAAEAEPRAFLLPAGWAKMLGMVGGAVFYIVVVSFLGHLISSALATAIVMRTQGDTNWLRIVGWSLILAVATYYGFVVVLQLRLPGPPLVPGFSFQP